MRCVLCQNDGSLGASLEEVVRGVWFCSAHKIRADLVEAIIKAGMPKVAVIDYPRPGPFDEVVQVRDPIQCTAVPQLIRRGDKSHAEWRERRYSGEALVRRGMGRVELKNPMKCTKASRVTVNGRALCSQHAGEELLRLLIKKEEAK